MSAGILSQVLPSDVRASPLLAPLLRELVAACVLRSALGYFTPTALTRVGGWGWCVCVRARVCSRGVCGWRANWR